MTLMTLLAELVSPTWVVPSGAGLAAIGAIIGIGQIGKGAVGSQCPSARRQ